MNSYHEETSNDPTNSDTTYDFNPVHVTTVAKYYPSIHKLHIQLLPPQTGNRQPVHVIAIIDNSGSMGEIADNTSTESHGFTRMDLVKHAIRTMISMLHENDHFGIVTFSTTAKVVVDPIPMTQSGKQLIHTALSHIKPEALTNIWDGIRLASELANKSDITNRNIAGILLTDGQPTGGHMHRFVETLQRLPMRNKWSLHTFGFGYQLDSKLLADIAKWGNGLFGFIPDCSMVGTVFINTLANILATAVPAGQYPITYSTSDSAEYILESGPIMLGQARDIIIQLPETGKQPLQIKSPGTGNEYIPIEIVTGSMDEYVSTYSEYLDILTRIIPMTSMEETTHILATFEQGHSRTDPRTVALLRDIRSDIEGEGQIGLAPRYMHTWGKHYMRAYLSAQTLQMSMNFKDPGLQIYGGELFHELQAQGDEIFCMLPPPTPSGISQGISAPVNMRAFHNASAGCFNGSTRIKMADNTTKMIREIKRGDIVWTPSGPSTVTALVVCNTSAYSQPMTQLGSLSITPWHPVRINNEWHFPADLRGYSSRPILTVYNLVLESGHIVNADDIECVTLGHGFTEPKVAHPFFGTGAVIDCLRGQPGWEVGRPVFKNLVATRDPYTNIINYWVDVV
jgi:hypothetical protein